MVTERLSDMTDYSSAPRPSSEVQSATPITTDACAARQPEKDQLEDQTGQENECENSGVVPHGHLLHARLWGSKFYLSSVERGSGSDMTRIGKAAEVTNDFVVRTLGLRQELGPVTKSILLSGFAWRKCKLSLAVECHMLRP